MTPAQHKAVLHVTDAIVDTVRAAGPLGAPGGVMYAALMAQGCSLQQFEQIMSVLVRIGELRKRGDCYFLASA